MSPPNDDELPVFSFWEDRHMPFWECGAIVAHRDIAVGEEILDNYIKYGGSSDPESWLENLRELQGMCSGQTPGVVTQYEQ